MSAKRVLPPAGRADGSLERDFGDALRRNALSIDYQPQYLLIGGQGCGVEALARWVLASGENVAPSLFIPIAERSGMIADLGTWVLKSACETAAAWRGRCEDSSMAINVSALQIDDAFCDALARTLAQYRYPARLLELEITESALIANPDQTIEHLWEWKRIGVQIAIDDFGSGYSSLSRLATLPVDRLKLDHSLVAMLTADPKSAVVIRSILRLAQELDLQVTAEGVETEQQFQILADLGCSQGQGYLLGRPMPARQAQVVLRKQWGNRPMPHQVAPSRGDCHAQ
jgi:EAL domain-containing protein (putative c-di-GMP-specific phosphodiesterase class I)